MRQRLLARCGFLASAALVLTGIGCSSGGDVNEVDVGQAGSALTANDKIAFDYFLGKGLTSFQAAGIVGNLDQESNMNPGAVQAGGPGRGIAQWSVGGRWDTDANDNAKWYATVVGGSTSTLSFQLDFIWYELTTFPNYGLAPLRASTNVTDATVAFEKDFEGCGTCDESQRIAYAKAALAAYGNDTVDGGGGAGDAGNACTVPSLNATGVCISTSACAAMPNHLSTPGFCPGPNDIECCTGPDAPDAATSPDGSTPPEQDGGGSSGSSGGPGGGSPGDQDATAGGDGGHVQPNSGAPGSGNQESGVADTGGCAASSSGTSGPGATWLAAIALLGVTRRRGRAGARGRDARRRLGF